VKLRSVRVNVIVAEKQRAKLLHFLASVALAIQHAKRVRLIMLVNVTSLSASYFSTLCRKGQDFRKNG
jgi:hypothetical protein